MDASQTQQKNKFQCCYCNAENKHFHQAIVHCTHIHGTETLKLYILEFQPAIQKWISKLQSYNIIPSVEGDNGRDILQGPNETVKRVVKKSGD